MLLSKRATNVRRGNVLERQGEGRTTMTGINFSRTHNCGANLFYLQLEQGFSKILENNRLGGYGHTSNHKNAICEVFTFFSFRNVRVHDGELLPFGIKDLLNVFFWN